MAEKNPQRFVTILEAVRLTGYSRGSINRWIKAGEVKTDVGREGQKTVWLPDALECSGAADEGGEAEYAEPNAKAYQEVVRALALSNKHVAELLGPIREVMALVLEENKDLRAQRKTQDDLLHSMHQRHESALSEEHNRRVAERRDEREQKRRDEMFSVLKQITPALLAGVAGHFGITQVQESALVLSLAALSDEQFRTLAASGMVPPETLAVIDRIRATAQKRKADTTNGTQQGHEQH